MAAYFSERDKVDDFIASYNSSKAEYVDCGFLITI